MTSPTLSLEQRVAALEEAAARPDQDAAYPTFVKLNPDGSIAFDFSGHVHAQGLDLDEFQGPFPSNVDDMIRWLDPAGTSRASIQAFNAAGVRETHFLFTGLMAIENVPQTTGLYIAASPASIIARVAGVPTDRTLLERTGGKNVSDWPQLDPVTIQAVSAIEVAADFRDIAVGGLNSNTSAVSHNFTGTPFSVVVTPDTTSAVCQVSNLTSTQFTIRAQHRDAGTLFPANTTVRCYWQAFASV